MTKQSTILILILWLSSTAFGQNDKKNSSSWYKKLTHLTMAELSSRSHSELARELSIESFISYYVDHGKNTFTKKYAHEYIDSLYKDSKYIYIVVRSETYPIDFIKVLISDMNDFSFSEIDGNEIRNKFLKEIIPEEDKVKVNSNFQSNCICEKYFDSHYLFNVAKKEIEIRYRWKVVCGLTKLLNKRYVAFYSITNRSFRL